ncbi:hypothetical protein GGD81_003671 [Rhodobium orientis]|nr:hypothetical protein [Rhodobium orientis]
MLGVEATKTHVVPQGQPNPHARLPATGAGRLVSGPHDTKLSLGSYCIGQNCASSGQQPVGAANPCHPAPRPVLILEVFSNFAAPRSVGCRIHKGFLAVYLCRGRRFKICKPLLRPAVGRCPGDPLGLSSGPRCNGANAGQPGTPRRAPGPAMPRSPSAGLFPRPLPQSITRSRCADPAGNPLIPLSATTNRQMCQVSGQGKGAQEGCCGVCQRPAKRVRRRQIPLAILPGRAVGPFEPFDPQRRRGRVFHRHGQDPAP